MPGTYTVTNANGIHNWLNIFPTQEPPTLKTGYSRSSLSPQDLASQVVKESESLYQELEEALVSMQAISTQLEAVAESYTVIQDRISSLRMAANQLQTSYLKKPRPGQPESAPESAALPPDTQQAPQIAGVVGQLTGLGLWQQGPG